jgi:hypothetical protein
MPPKTWVNGSVSGSRQGWIPVWTTRILQQLVPVAVELLVARLVAVVRRPGLSPAIAPSRRSAPMSWKSPVDRARSGWKPWSMPQRIARDRDVTPIFRYAERM